MTRIQYESHAEQMEAYRKEFAEYWNPIRWARKTTLHLTDKELAMIEFNEWKTHG